MGIPNSFRRSMGVALAAADPGNIGTRFVS